MSISKFRAVGAFVRRSISISPLRMSHLLEEARRIAVSRSVVGIKS